MSSISNNSSTVSSSLLAAMNPSSASKTSDVQTAQNNFLTLLVTQMKNQDPMNPMDNAQVTSQMAQLSTVTGINQLNSTMASLSNSYQTSQNLQAATLIGRSVVAPGNSMYLGSGSSATYGVSLPGNANNVTVTVRNAAGQVVKTINAGALPAGDNKLSWDGTMTNGAAAPAGTYTFSVAATASGQSVAASGIEYGTVASVVANATGVQLNLANNLGQINLADIKQVS